MKRFNLMPQDIGYAEAASRDVGGSRDVALIIISLPIIVAIALIYFLHTQQKPEVRTSSENLTQVKKLETLKQEYVALEASAKARSDTANFIEERNRLKNNLDTIKSLNLVKSVPLDLLVAIGRNITEKLALTVISKKEGLVSLEGIARDNKSLSDFMETLVSQNIFKNISIKATEYSDEYGPYKQKFIIVGML